jgi:hypothetical protein
MIKGKDRRNQRKRGEGGSAPPARPAPPGGGEAAASSSLDKWTSYVQPHWGNTPRGYRVVVRDYGQGVMEATATIARPDTAKRGKKGTHKTPDDAELSPEAIAENIERAVARAKTTMRRSVMAAILDHLLTLTYRENMQDRKRAWQDFAKFMRFVKKSLGKKSYHFVAVQELQQRGAVHIHVAVAGFQDVKLLRSIWHQVIGGPEAGNIDVQFFKGQRSRLAKYLAKYLAKDMTQTQRGLHRYKRSRGILVPEEVILLPPSVAIDSELIGLFERRGAKMKFHKNNLNREGPKWLWLCSW